MLCTPQCECVGTKYTCVIEEQISRNLRIRNSRSIRVSYVKKKANLFSSSEKSKKSCLFKGFQITFKETNIIHPTFNNNTINSNSNNNFYANRNGINKIKNNNTSKTCENVIINFTGNCLELAASGVLNQVPCNMTFSNGCPDVFFFSPDLYRCKFNC